MEEDMVPLAVFLFGIVVGVLGTVWYKGDRHSLDVLVRDEFLKTFGKFNEQVVETELLKCARVLNEAFVSLREMHRLGPLQTMSSQDPLSGGGPGSLSPEMAAQIEVSFAHNQNDRAVALALLNGYGNVVARVQKQLQNQK